MTRMNKCLWIAGNTDTDTDTAARFHVFLVKDSFITQDRNEQIKGVKVEATFSRGHISLI